MSQPDLPALRHITEKELATIGKIVLLWGQHEQNVGTIVSVHYKVPREACADLVHALGYSRKVDLAASALRSINAAEIAAELQHIKRVFRPERDTLAHGAYGLWGKEAWVRSIAKPRFVLADDLDQLHARASYAAAISVEAVSRIHELTPSRPRPPRPADPTGTVPQAWLDHS